MTDSAVAEPELLELLERMALVQPGETVQADALTGGVSSDIWLVRRGADTFVVKRAREKLNVAAEWHAPIDRGAAEEAWLRFVAAAVPGCVPRVLAVDEESFAIALEYLDAAEYRNWKSELLAGRVDVGVAATLGTTLGRIHAVSSGTPGLPAQFANQELFESLRIEPYLLRTADAVPEAQAALDAVVAGLREPGRALVHGDLSPKNILVGAVPVILDAECATWGDPAFDAAFCLTHLVLKQVHLPDHAAELRRAAEAFERAYLDEVVWEDAAETQARIARILPALALARVAGASPAEYLDDGERERIRASAVLALNTGRALVDVLDEQAGA